MAIQKVAMFAFAITREWSSEPELRITNLDMSGAEGYNFLSLQEVEIDIPEFDARGVMIETLETAVQKERAESQSKINLLLERISKLKAIGHDAPVNS